MPAGPRYIYFGVTLTNEKLDHLLDMKSFFANGSSVWEYLEQVEDMLRGFGHNGTLHLIQGPALSPAPALSNIPVATYGYEIASYEIFDDIVFLPRRPPKKTARKLYNFIRATGMTLKPCMYSKYSGD